jgi:1-phosphatidylinositol-4-phosphate 5-kinase
MNMPKPATNTATNQSHETDAQKSEKMNINQEDPEPRVLTTVRSPSTDRTGNPQGQTLPVVEELGESSSLGGKSGRSRERDDQSMAPGNDVEEARPVTPMKDFSSNKSGLRMVARSSLDKELPPLPQVESPREMRAGESIFP